MIFPSHELRAALRQQIKTGGFKNLTPVELAQYHADNYGWRRAKLGDFSEMYPLDPRGEHYDAHLAGLAAQFYGYKPSKSPSSTLTREQQIAHVEDCARRIRAILADIGQRNRNVFAEDREALRLVREQLGVMAEEVK